MDTFFASGRPNIIVTGGAGFLGSHLTDSLLKFANVIAIDNFITGSEHNIDAFLTHPNYEFIRHDFTLPLDIQSLPELKKFKISIQGIQQIYHLACPTSPKEYKRIPIETLHANAFAMKHALDLALSFKAKLLHASSSAIYGEPENDALIPETWFGYVDPIGPRSSYSEGKRFAEAMCWNYKSTYHLDVRILRIFNTYGPRMRLNDGRLVPDLVRTALQGKPLTIHGEEDATSTFCFVSDMVDGMIKAMEASLDRPVNIGSDNPVSIRSVAEKIVALTGSKSPIHFEPHEDYTTRQTVPDTSFAKQELNWWPLVDLDNGLQKTVDQMKTMAHLYNADAEKREQ